MFTPPLLAPLRRMAEPTPFLPLFFSPPEIASFWGTSIAINPSETQEVLPTSAGRKYSTGSSPLTSSPSMTLTHPPFYIASLAVARWDDFVSNFDSHCSFAEEYSSLFLSSAAALFTSLALNAAKYSISFGRIKRHPKAWWSAEVEGAVSKRRKAFAAAYRSDEDCQAYISTSRCASSVIAKANDLLFFFTLIKPENCI